MVLFNNVFYLWSSKYCNSIGKKTLIYDIPITSLHHISNLKEIENGKTLTYAIFPSQTKWLSTCKLIHVNVILFLSACFHLPLLLLLCRLFIKSFVCCLSKTHIFDILHMLRMMVGFHIFVYDALH